MSMLFLHIAYFNLSIQLLGIHVNDDLATVPEGI